MNKERCINRYLRQRLFTKEKKSILLITGARQTGKTTLIKHFYPDLPYINFDAIEEREKALKIPSALWSKQMGPSVIDEVQKAPQVMEKIKYAFDSKQLSFSVLSGSSQILLLNKIRETLAGRITIYELFPLMLSELTQKTPLLDFIIQEQSFEKILQNVSPTLFGKEESLRKEAQRYLLQWGGMPSLLHLPENERSKWLKDYEYTYLERDLSDLARVQDLYQFKTFQKFCALRASQILHYSELARDAVLSVDSARRFIRYLEISYQTFLLRPYRINQTTTMIKSPKLYWIDTGILRQLSGFYGEISGQIYENFVISEIYKWIKTSEKNVEMFFYRTYGGAECDLLLKTQNGLIGIEIKSRTKVIPKDFSILKELAQKFSSEWLGGIVIYNGGVIEKVSKKNIWAIPSWRLLSN